MAGFPSGDRDETELAAAGVRDPRRRRSDAAGPRACRRARSGNSRGANPYVEQWTRYAMTITSQQQRLLLALSGLQWRMLASLKGPFQSLDAEELVRLRLAEKRPHPTRNGILAYRRTYAGQLAIEG